MADASESSLDELQNPAKRRLSSTQVPAVEVKSEASRPAPMCITPTNAIVLGLNPEIQQLMQMTPTSMTKDDCKGALLLAYMRFRSLQTQQQDTGNDDSQSMSTGVSEDHTEPDVMHSLDTLAQVLSSPASVRSAISIMQRTISPFTSRLPSAFPWPNPMVLPSSPARLSMPVHSQGPAIACAMAVDNAQSQSSINQVPAPSGNVHGTSGGDGSSSTDTSALPAAANVLDSFLTLVRQ